MLRVDVTAKPVGSFFGGNQRASLSFVCPVCRQPGLLIGERRTGLLITRRISHGFETRLNIHNEPVCTWDEPCLDREKLPE